MKNVCGKLTDAQGALRGVQSWFVVGSQRCHVVNMNTEIAHIIITNIVNVRMGIDGVVTKLRRIARVRGKRINDRTTLCII